MKCFGCRYLERARQNARNPVCVVRSLTKTAFAIYCETMKNITVSLDDECYRRARIRAAELDTSVSAMVRQFLAEVVAGESDTERLKREEARLRASIHSFRAGDRLTRDEVHTRQS